MVVLYDAAVIGAGPAGCSAAVQCRRQGLDVIIVDTRGEAGGLIREARLIENYPGLEKPLTGSEFARRLISIISANNLEIRCFHADSVVKSGDIFEVSGEGERIRSRSVIVATGTVPKGFSIEVSGNAKIHRSVLELKRKPPKRTIIVGSGEAALDYSLNLSDSGSTVSILARGSSLRAAGDLRKEIEKRSIVQILYNTVPVKVSGSKGIIHLEARTSGTKILLEADAVLAAVGREARLPQIMNDFVHDRGNVETSIPGLYLSGDASMGSLGQTAIASGQGVQAAACVYELLKARGDNENRWTAR